jgi:large repetitive protein
MKNKRFGLRLLSLIIGLGLVFQFVGYGKAVGPVVDLAVSDQYDLIARGANTNAFLGEIDARGDINADGKKDLLIGASGTTVIMGEEDVRENAGAAYVILGGTGDKTHNFAATPPALTIYGAQPGDILGHSVASADVTGDGHADLIIGADQFNGDPTKRGIVYVILGKDLQFSSGVLDMATYTPALTIIGEFEGSRLGRAVGAGDVDGDGIADIIVGAPIARSESGAVYVFKGGPHISNASPQTINLADPAVSASLTIYGGQGVTTAVFEQIRSLELQAGPFFADEINLPNAGRGDRIGRTMAVGDVNGNGFGDLIISAYGADVNDRIDAGRTYVFFGKSDLLNGSVIDLAVTPNAPNVIINGIDTNDQSGFNVAAGKINADGYADIIISAYTSSGENNAHTQAGEVYVVYGRSDISGTINLATQADVTISGAAANHRLGRSIAAADVMGTPHDDLLLGASRATYDTRAYAGMVFVIRGGQNLPNVIRLSQPDTANITIIGATGGVACTVDEDYHVDDDCSDEAGRAVTGGDFTGNGVADIFIGALFVNNGGLINAGAVYGIYTERHLLYLPTIIR